MSENELDRRKGQFMDWERKLSAQQRLLFRITAVLDVLMILYVPKVASVSNALMGNESHPLGYSFIFSQPEGGGGAAADFLGVSVHIDFVKLIIQLIVVNGIAFFVMKYLKEKSPTT